MRRIFVFFAPLIAATLLPLLALASAGSTLYTSIVTADETGCQVAVSLPDAGLIEISSEQGLGHAIELEGMIPISASGDPALQALVWTLEIPATSDVEYQLDYEVTLLENIDLLPQASDSPEVEMEISNLWFEDRFYPESILTISDPAIARNHRLVQVTLTPYQYNPVTRQLRVYSDLQVDFTFGGINEINQVTMSLPPSATFENMLQHSVLNYEAMNQNSRDYDQNLGLDPILYIYDSAIYSYLEPLLEWKRQKGQVVYTATQMQVSLDSYSSVKAYITNAYTGWDNPPVFVTLVGDPSSCSFTDVAASNSTGDHDYSRVEGGDMLGDVFIGRLSVNNATMLQNVVNKQLSYEKTPYMADPSWMYSAHLYADSNSSSGWSTAFTSENIKYKMLNGGITSVTDCYAHECSTPEASSIANAFNNGIGYFNYRGYYLMNGWTNTNANNLTNGYQLPFVVDITCSTGDYVNGYAFSEGFYQVGTVSNPRGAVAAIGTATAGTNTRCNNVVDLGIFGGIFDYLLPTAGEALFQGKFDLWMSYNNLYSSYVTNFSNWNNLMGDASLVLRTRVPSYQSVTHASTIVPQAGGYTVHAESGGLPLSDAVVCLYQEGVATAKGLTDANGDVMLSLEGQFSSGQLTLTVTRQNYYPYTSTVNVVSQNLWVSAESGVLDDDNSGNSAGNDDGVLNPGEEIELTLNLTNLGNSITAYSVNATISCDDPRVTIQQDYSSFSNIAPGATIASNALYRFSVNSLIDSEAPQNIALEVITSTSSGSFESVLPLNLAEPVLRLEMLETDPDGDDQISQGETGELAFQLYNSGTIATGTLNATLTSDDPQITIVDGTAAFNSISAGATGSNTSYFLVRPAANAFNGHPFDLTLSLINGDGMELIIQSQFAVGPLMEDDPSGPVEGYYCFDSNDLYYSQHPTYNWVEISSTGTVIPLTDNSDEADDSYMVALPFDFNYFGNSFNRITVCSNGWIAMGSQSQQVNFRNYSIPTSIGPSDMIAPFWDDLRVNTTGVSRRVYYQYDSANHRFIIEWYQLLQVGTGSPTETFQVILYDQDYLPSDNGDILFQYQDVTNNTNNYGDNDYATVGIENGDQTSGIEYSYWNTYPDASAPLVDGLAILFTQTPGIFSYDDAQPPVISHVNQPLLDGYGPFTLEADLADPSGIDNASLFWSLNGVSFNEVAMTVVIGDTWAGTVPAQPLGTTVYYYFQAEDASDNHNQSTSTTYTFINGIMEVYYAVDVESGVEGWTHSSPTGWGDQWHISTEDNHSSTHSWKSGDADAGEYEALLDSRLLLPEVTITPYSQLSVFHRMQAEVSGLYPDSAYDGGIIEISTDGGGSWDLLIPDSGYNKYFRTSSGGGAPCTHPFDGGTSCYSGEFGWQELTVDMGAWTDQTVQLRFRFGSDQGGGMEGWYVDDLTLTGLSMAEPEPLVITIAYNDPFVTVSWDAVPQATAYRVYSSDDAHSGFELVQETGLTSHTTYATENYRFFRVTWVN